MSTLYTTPAGYPRTFSLADAAQITGLSVSNLRNHVARDILKHVGQIPLAGQERRFTVTGLVEIALIGELSAARYPVATAARLTESLIGFAYAKASLSGKGVKHASFAEYATDPGATSVHFDCHPGDWMIGPWASRNLSEPKIAVFLFEDNLSVIVGRRFADGWADVPKARFEALQSFYRTGGLLQSLPVGSPGTPMPKPRNADDPIFAEEWPVMGTLNITSVLCKIDKGIREKLGAAAQNTPTSHSYRSATIGSTRVARRAGR
jgi:hypothetical protein